MSLAEKLVSLRKQKGLTQMDLADQVNVSRQAISRWEVGAAVPSIDNLRVLGELYDVPVDYLLDDDCEEIHKRNDKQEPDISIQSTTYKKHKCGVLFFCAVAIVLSIAAIIAMSEVRNRKQEERVPIADMTIEEDDDYEIVTFPLE